MGWMWREAQPSRSPFMLAVNGIEDKMVLRFVNPIAMERFWKGNHDQKFGNGQPGRIL
ncbi:hypothetical protein DESC_720439 [Desulfosarcina cetonica]|nr:hypothetical protein DESC_720439 [Desulfosarcina cetonica]